MYLFRLRQAAAVWTTAAALVMVAGCSTPKAKLSWDWSGVIGTGQSLSVGARGTPVLSTNQPYNNLKLSTDHLPWPVDPNDTNLTLVPLIEPVGRLAHHYPSSWPENIDGETPRSAMANEITARLQVQVLPDAPGSALFCDRR